MSELKLEVGKRYLARNGLVAEITGRGRAPECVGENRARFYELAGVLPMLGQELCWRSDGVFDDEQENCALNLISELPAEDSEPAPGEEFTPPEFVEVAAPLQLEVGKFYRARNGDVVKIDREDHDHTFASGGFHFMSGSRSYAANGRYSLDPCGIDLIEEVPAPVAEAVAEMELEAEEPSRRANSSGEPFSNWLDRTASEREAAITSHICANTEPVDLGEYGVRKFPDLGVKLEGDTFKVAFPPPPGETATETSDRYEDEYVRDKEDQRLTSRADRFATYCRAILFVMLGVAAMTFATRATARELLSIPNNAGGEIILTDTTSEHCDGSARLAISRAAGGKTIVGCWVYSDAGYVYVKWGDDLRLYKLTDFKVIEQFDGPEKPVTQTTPWRGAL